MDRLLYFIHWHTPPGRRRPGCPDIPGRWAHVHQEISPQGNRLHQHPNEHFRGLPGHLVPVVPPGAGKGLAGLPGDQLPGFRMPHPGLGLVLLGGPDVLINFRPVVDKDVRLQPPGRGNEPLRIPVRPCPCPSSSSPRRDCRNRKNRTRGCQFSR